MSGVIGWETTFERGLKGLFDWANGWVMLAALKDKYGGISLTGE